MKNIYFNTENVEYVILEVENDQKIISGIESYVKTDGKLEEILLKTYFNDFQYILLGKLSDTFFYSKIHDYEINTKEKFQSFISTNHIELDKNKIYYLFKKNKNG
ncbi:hypothetical protein [Chryseobacterium sp. 2987]|uniref:hypothetical protein n=1 Tax=Chryseobacterium sp. 2987 TaxID=2817767 RepID=UPI00285AC987|nr:hypothetical protein [Chryseobacterium sp. 2987]MDR6921222.1 hypothetical protein [Chryseobacterium sp. 2987]